MGANLSVWLCEATDGLPEGDTARGAQLLDGLSGAILSACPPILPLQEALAR